MNKSNHSEPFLPLRDGVHQLLDQYLLGAVIGQVELVEAGVGAGESLLLEFPVDVESLHPVHAPQVLEALDRHPRAACDELDEGGSELHVEALEDFEEPYDYWIVFHIIYQFCISAEVLDVDGGASRDHNFQLFLIENLQQSMRHQFVQPCEKGLELQFDAGGHLGVGDQLDVLQLVLLCDGEVGAVGDQLLRLDLSEIVAVVGEGQLQEIFDGGVVEHPGQRFEVFVVLLLHVPVGDGDRQDVLVERWGKVCVEEVPVIEGLSCDPADELEVV